MRKLTLSLALVFILVPVAYAATTDVKVKDDFFKPNEVTINKDDKVRWLWRGEDIHNVAIRKLGSKQIKRRSDFKTEGKFVHRFKKAGTWKVLCETHPDDMRMKVIVRSPQRAPAT